MATGFSHHRKSNLLTFGQGRVGRKTIDTNETLLLSGPEPLDGRHTMYIINDSSSLIYLSTQSSFNIEDGAIILFSGEVLSFSFDPNPPIDDPPISIYGKVEENTADIRILEVN